MGFPVPRDPRLATTYEVLEQEMKRLRSAGVAYRTRTRTPA